MPYGKLLLQPGIDTRLSQATAKGRWWASQLIRWMGGLPQKLGGWQRLINTALTGTSREIHVWSDLNGIPYLASGSEQWLEVLASGELFNITPIRATDNVAVSFSTTASSKTVTITDAGNGVSVGDWVNIVTTVSVGGILLQGYYLVESVVDSNNYTITAADAATSTVSNGGAVSAFATTDTSATVTVTLDNHGYAVGDLYTVHVSTTVATVVLDGQYNVASVVDANSFTITATTTANATTTGSENGGDVRLQYQLPSGHASVTALSGYGVGMYGAGFYGEGSGSSTAPFRQWFLDNWGKDLVGSYNGGGIYVWITPDTSTPAAIVSGAPTLNNATFVMAPEQILVALGSETGGVQDPLLIRWCDVADYNTWVASSTNQAGSYRISTGSKIVGGVFASQQAIIHTDVDVWSMTYQNVPFVFGFNQIGRACGLIASNAIAIIGGRYFWLSLDNFFTLGPSGAEPIPCPVWDQIFRNINTEQIAKTFFAVNDYFNEVMCFYPSASGTGEIDSYVKFTITDSGLLWDYGTLTRTAWTPESALGSPIGVDGTGLLQQHEVGNDADGNPITWFVESGYFDIGEGEDFAFVDQLIPDYSASTTTGAQIQHTLSTTRWAGDTPLTYGPYTATVPASVLSVRARGRQMAIKIGGNDLGSFVRLGATRYRYAASGRN